MCFLFRATYRMTSPTSTINAAKRMSSQGDAPVTGIRTDSVTLIVNVDSAVWPLESVSWYLIVDLPTKPGSGVKRILPSSTVHVPPLTSTAFGKAMKMLLPNQILIGEHRPSGALTLLADGASPCLPTARPPNPQPRLDGVYLDDTARDLIR